MADLKSLFSKKDSDASIEGSPAEPTAVPSPPPAATTATPKPVNPFSARGGDDSQSETVDSGGGTPTPSGNVSSGGEPESRLAGVFDRARSGDTGGPAEQVVGATLDSLEQLDNTLDEGVAPRGSGVSYFADETPATKPTRELPEGLSKESLGFVDMLDSVYEIIHDPELLGGVIRNIMVELKSNAEYTRLMSPDDVRVMVRGMRESMGLAVVKKTEAKSKRAGGTARKSKAADIDMLGDIDSILGDIG